MPPGIGYGTDRKRKRGIVANGVEQPEYFADREAVAIQRAPRMPRLPNEGVRDKTPRMYLGASNAQAPMPFGDARVNRVYDMLTTQDRAAQAQLAPVTRRKVVPLIEAYRGGFSASGRGTEGSVAARPGSAFSKRRIGRSRAEKRADEEAEYLNRLNAQLDPNIVAAGGYRGRRGLSGAGVRRGGVQGADGTMAAPDTGYAERVYNSLKLTKAYEDLIGARTDRERAAAKDRYDAAKFELDRMKKAQDIVFGEEDQEFKREDQTFDRAKERREVTKFGREQFTADVTYASNRIVAQFDDLQDESGKSNGIVEVAAQRLMQGGISGPEAATVLEKYRELRNALASGGLEALSREDRARMMQLQGLGLPFTLPKTTEGEMQRRRNVANVS